MACAMLASPAAICGFAAAHSASLGRKSTSVVWSSLGARRVVGDGHAGSSWSIATKRQALSFKALQHKPAFSFAITAVSSNDFRPGTTIEIDGAPYRVQEFLHVKPGKGAAFVRTKLKNFLTGNTVDRTFRAGETVDEAVVVKDLKQFTYKDGDQYVFMDMSTYEETRVTSKELGMGEKWIKEGMECYVLQWSNKVIAVDLPQTVKLTVVETDPGIKGDTAGGGGQKPAVVDTGATVTVPLFVNVGDEIIIDTKAGTYSSRA